MTHVMWEGTSEPQDLQLLTNGEPLDGTQWDVTIEFEPPVDDWEDDVSVAWLDQAAGTVRVTGTENMPIGRHHFRFALTDVVAKIGYVPTRDLPPGLWIVKGWT